MFCSISIASYANPVTRQITFKTGTYRGEVIRKDGRKLVPHGIGVFVWFAGNKQRYQGKFVLGKIGGKGRVYYRDGTTCSGDFDAGVNINSYAICTYKGGSRYEGGMTNNKRQENGTFYYTNGDKYLGKWDRDHKQGHGEMYYANGSTYKGDWLNGKRHGSRGVLDVPNGKSGAVRYVGRFVDGNMQGKGLIEFYEQFRTYCVFMEKGRMVSKRRNLGSRSNCQ